MLEDLLDAQTSLCYWERQYLGTLQVVDDLAVGVPPAVIWKVWLIKPLPSGWIEMSGPSSHVCWTKFNEFLRCVSGSVMEEGCPPAPQGSYSVCLVVDCWWFVTVDLEVSRLQHNPAERI